MKRIRTHKEVRFVIEKNGCWNCTSHSKNKKGYSRITWKGIHTSISRWIYQECFGELDKGLVVRHKCDNPSCINPSHLEKGTPLENTQDAIKRNRFSSKSKLTEAQVEYVLESDKGARELGRQFKISHTSIIRIRKKSEAEV